MEAIKDQKLKSSVLNIIIKIEACHSISEINNLKKLKGFKNFYRIRSGGYRIGVQIENEVVTFAAFHHRKDIYKHFP